MAWGSIQRPRGVLKQAASTSQASPAGPPPYREHSHYMEEASFDLGLLKDMNTTVGPATRAGCQKQGWVLAGRVRSPLQAAFSDTGQISYPAGCPNAPTPAALHLEWSPSPHHPSLGYLLLLTC